MTLTQQQYEAEILFAQALQLIRDQRIREHVTSAANALMRVREKKVREDMRQQFKAMTTPMAPAPAQDVDWFMQGLNDFKIAKQNKA